jgi:hypothetical protein
MAVAGVARMLGINDRTFCCWKKVWGANGPVEVCISRQLEEEEARCSCWWRICFWNENASRGDLEKLPKPAQMRILVELRSQTLPGSRATPPIGPARLSLYL